MDDDLCVCLCIIDCRLHKEDVVNVGAQDLFSGAMIILNALNVVYALVNLH